MTEDPEMKGIEEVLLILQKSKGFYDTLKGNNVNRMPEN